MEQKVLNQFYERILKAFMDIAILVKMMKESPLSGFDVVSYFNSRFGLQISPGSVYSSLYNMERDRLIESEKGLLKNIRILVV